MSQIILFTIHSKNTTLSIIFSIIIPELTLQAYILFFTYTVTINIRCKTMSVVNLCKQQKRSLLKMFRFTAPSLDLMPFLVFQLCSSILIMGCMLQVFFYNKTLNSTLGCRLYKICTDRTKTQMSWDFFVLEKMPGMSQASRVGSRPTKSRGIFYGISWSIVLLKTENG